MFVKGRIGIVLKASGYAVLWVLIVTFTIFPELLESKGSFLTERYIFGNVGQSMLFTLGIYTFDLMIQVLYSIDKHLSKIFIANILGGVTACVLSISLTKNMGVSNIWPFLFVGIAMIYMKAVTLYMSDKTKKVGNEESEVKSL